MLCYYKACLMSDGTTYSWGSGELKSVGIVCPSITTNSFIRREDPSPAAVGARSTDRMSFSPVENFAMVEVRWRGGGFESSKHPHS